MSGPFEAIRVIDLSSGQAGGVATMVLADFGADVIKVEPPGGDPRRDEAAAPMWLRGKRSVELDLAALAGRAQLHGRVRGADVVVASYAPGDAEPFGADYATLSALNGGHVYCSITGWGPRGPYARCPADERLVAAKSGRLQAFAGVVRRDGPAFEAVRVGTHVASQSAIAGILGALLVRDRLGAGQLVETSWPARDAALRFPDPDPRVAAAALPGAIGGRSVRELRCRLDADARLPARDDE